jgi:hypothetical protein
MQNSEFRSATYENLKFLYAVLPNNSDILPYRSQSKRSAKQQNGAANNEWGVLVQGSLD